MEIILGIACFLLLLLCLTLGSVCGKLSAQKEQIEAMEKIVENYKAELKRASDKNLVLNAENLKLKQKSNSTVKVWSAIIAAVSQLNKEKIAETTTPEMPEEPEMPETPEEPETPKDGEIMPLPDCPTNVLSCEPYMTKEKDESGNIRYKSAFAANSEQAVLQEDCFTDENGIRYITINGKKCLCAALATAYSAEIGTVFAVTLHCGEKMYVICADFKNPLSEAGEPIYGTPCTNYDGEEALGLIEFVVDWTKLPRVVKDAGTFTILPNFGGLYGNGGNVVKMEKLGRWWKP